MNDETEKLLKQLKAYRNELVARNYPFQAVSNIITRWETKDFLEEAIKEEKELNDSYKESKRQTEERQQLTKKEKDDTTTTI